VKSDHFRDGPLTMFLVDNLPPRLMDREFALTTLAFKTFY
jgi:hypothetical protein